MNQIDPTLLPRLKKSDPRVLREIFDHYHSALFRYACKFLNNEEAIEVVQDTFVYIWQQRHDLVIHKTLSLFLFGVVRNKCLKCLRKKTSLIAIDSTDHRLKIEELDYYDENPLVIQTLIEQELNVELDNALKKLPPKCYQVFKMSRFDGLKNREIAEELDVSVKSIEKHISKALTILKAELKDYLPLIFSIYPYLFK